jgi:hypothetical protein
LPKCGEQALEPDLELWDLGNQDPSQLLVVPEHALPAAAEPIKEARSVGVEVFDDVVQVGHLVAGFHE